MLSTHRSELEIAARELGSQMDTAHASDTGVKAPVGRTSLREMLEGAIGESRALVLAGQDDVGKVVARLMNLETQSQELDLRLGAGWEDLPL
ncbi:hypothetical protein DY023_16655 [Microbacterium bovistercoris]|uniref:Uncharacterized protein n=1 Tax=Microbacterium bovistercoris TaxID=2293570 RepID=A0A371NP36_9MICO|nr:hypothetical protein DY023_16655 [Microbacterium bovistercoris]